MLSRQDGRAGMMRILRDAIGTVRGKVGAGLSLAVVLFAAAGPLLTPHSPTEFTSIPYSPPGAGDGLLGGDSLGRDVLSRTMDGGWLLLVIAVLATFLAVVVGALLAIAAAYLGGALEALIMRGVDIGLALPQLVLALLLVSVAGPKLWLIVVAVAASQAPQVARVIFSSAQDIVERDFVKVVRAWGMAPWRVIRSEVMPNLLGPLMVESGIRLSYSIIVVSGLAYLGFGRQPPNADWGVMISENRLGLVTNPWGVLAPAILLAILAIGTNTFADAIARTTLAESRAQETKPKAEVGGSL